MKITIRRDNDPFKKYWWVILLGFAMVGGWVCLPLMDSGTGGTSVPTEQGLKSADQSLDAASGGFQAPGSAVDLGMGGAYKKKGGPVTSYLYQPPPETAAPGGPIGDNKSTLAKSLEGISKRTVSASADISGWGGEKAQRGFSAPKANFGSMSGLGSGGGSGTSASASAGGSGGPGLSAFGSERPQTGLATTRGLAEGGADDKGGKAIMKSLESASAKSIAAASQLGADASKAMGGASFDGGGMGSGKVGGPGGGQSQGAAGGVYASLDKAPANLKMNDPSLSKKEIKPPPSKMEKKETSMRDKIMEMIITALISGLVGGFANGIVGMVFPGAKAADAKGGGSTGGTGDGD